MESLSSERGYWLLREGSWQNRENLVTIKLLRDNISQSVKIGIRTWRLSTREAGARSFMDGLGRTSGSGTHWRPRTMPKPSSALSTLGTMGGNHNCATFGRFATALHRLWKWLFGSQAGQCLWRS